MSWIDRLVRWGTTRRIPWWVLVGAYSAFAAIGINAVRWLDGSLEAGRFAKATGDFLYGVIPLVGYGILTHVAGRSLERFRPALGAATDEEALRTRLTTLPVTVAAVAGVAGLGLGVVAFVSDPALVDLYDASPISLVFAAIFTLMLNVAMSLTLIVRIARIIGGVAGAHRDAGEVDVLHPEPAHAFASLTAWCGALVILQVTYSALTDETTFTNPVWIGFLIVIVVISVVAFFLPLVEMRRRLAQEKRRLVDETERLVDHATSEIETAFRSGELDRVGPLKTSRDVFESHLTRVQKASTWPWDTGTLRGFGSSLLLPLISWFITSVLGEWLGL